MMTRNEQRLILVCVIVLSAGLLFLFLNRYRFYYNYVKIALEEMEMSAVRTKEKPADIQKGSTGEGTSKSAPSKAKGTKKTVGGDSERAGPEGVREVKEPIPARKIDINRAGLEDLMSLPGVGRVTALNIIEYRTRAGGFADVEELLEVKGIGPKKLEAVRERVVVE